MALEQLYYTWSRRGLSGANRFQVVAASPRLVQVSKLRDFLLQFCSYTLPPVSPGQQPPASFGWVNYDSRLRVAFSRRRGALDGAGRAGNVAAHIVVGTPSELDVRTIAASFGGRSWWTGEPERVPGDGRLEPLDRLEVPASDAADPPSRVGPMAEALLGREGQRLWFPMEPAEMMGSIAHLADLLPGLLDDLSVSTYETQGLAEHFDVLGSAYGPLNGFAPPPRSKRNAPLRLAGEFIGRSEGWARNTVRHAWTDSLSRPETGRAEFISLCAASTVDEREGALSGDQAALFLRSPAVAEDALSRARRLRPAIAAAFAGGHPDVVRRFEEIHGRLSPDIRAAFRDAVGDQAVSLEPAELTALTARAIVLDRQMPDAIAAALLAAGERAATPIAGWPWRLVPAGLQRASGPERAELVRRGSEVVVELANSDVPDRDYAEMVRLALDARPPHPVAIVEALFAWPDRLAAVTGTVEANRLADLFATVEPRRVLAVLADFPRKVQGEPFEPIIRAGLEVTPLVYAVERLEGVRRSLRLSRPFIAAAALELVHRHRRSEEAGSRLDQPLDFELVIRVGRGLVGSEVSAWSELAQGLVRGPRGAERARKALHGFSDRDRVAAVRWAVQGSIAAWDHPESVYPILWEALQYGLAPAEPLASAILAGGRRGMVAYRRPQAGAHAVEMIAVLVQYGHLRPTGRFFRDDQLAEPMLQSIAQRLARETAESPRGAEGLEHAYRVCDENGRRWLKTLGIKDPDSATKRPSSSERRL